MGSSIKQMKSKLVIRLSSWSVDWLDQQVESSSLIGVTDRVSDGNNIRLLTPRKCFQYKINAYSINAKNTKRMQLKIQIWKVKLNIYHNVYKNGLFHLYLESIHSITLWWVCCGTCWNINQHQEKSYEKSHSPRNNRWRYEKTHLGWGKNHFFEWELFPDVLKLHLSCTHETKTKSPAGRK